MLDLINVSYDTQIPNNVGLSSDKRVLKALEKWHPGYINWWNDLIPDNFQQSLVYLRTAVSVDPKGWAKFDYVKMPEYRWGVLLAPQVEDRTIPCGEHAGEAAWQEVLRLAPDADTPGMWEQFDCHWTWARLLEPDKPTWNVEPWRPVVSPERMLAEGCNPGGREVGAGQREVRAGRRTGR